MQLVATFSGSYPAYVASGGEQLVQPFSITLFATTGDPEGIRHLDKSNWSGYGVVFNRELFHLLKQEPGIAHDHCTQASGLKAGPL
jgi:hypothetical protein